jgi:hypothetical protein
MAGRNHRRDESEPPTVFHHQVDRPKTPATWTGFRWEGTQS